VNKKELLKKLEKLEIQLVNKERQRNVLQDVLLKQKEINVKNQTEHNLEKERLEKIIDHLIDVGKKLLD
jgi:hypothetical protein